ncbi:E3 SUMO-protein ligase ZBED1-like [Colletes gigas]|uniref:E3 SUMO-protein ligase ZBED1-like n=1 Tax=Colletes gigas TaxID=935657 RepID=UPI001C9A9224|nr:E3 SUMO-protein ligase ZBED1-like [Colletes gigas]
MSVVQPNYKICKDEAMKKRLMGLKSTVVTKIREQLNAVKNVVCTSDCWSSLAQDSYIAITVHIINSNWGTDSFVLSVYEMEERHTAQNLADELQRTLEEWEINSKVVAIVTDNAKNMVNAISLLSEVSDNTNIYSVTCAAHSVQLAVNHALKEKTVQQIIDTCSKMVGHFKHSNVAKHALQEKQVQLSLPKNTLIQSCSTRWNSTYFMLDSLYTNRCAISNVIADRAITNARVAQSLEINEKQWTIIESLLNILKPLQIITTLFCGESHSPISMVRPLIKKLIEKHLNLNNDDDTLLCIFKKTIISELTRRFKLEWIEGDTLSLNHISCFFDPRYKNLEHETSDVKEIIRTEAKRLLQNSDVVNAVHTVNTVNTAKAHDKSALEFLYNEITDKNDVYIQIETYMTEPQLRFDLNPFEWWKARTNKYPAISEVAKKYLTIPATSAIEC